MTAWRQWLDHPEKSWVRNIFFQVHLWVGAAVAAYILLMSVTGSLIVYRNELATKLRDRGHLSDAALPDGSGDMVAGHQILAPQPDRGMEGAFRANQLGPAQRARLLVFWIRSTMGALRHLLFVSATISRSC